MTGIEEEEINPGDVDWHQAAQNLQVEVTRLRAVAFVPKVLPFGILATPGAIEDVWDTFVGPDQEAENPPSTEMRILMAVLREAFRVLAQQEHHAEKAEV